MGFIKNPAKSIKNLIYHKYTVGLPDIVKRIKKTNPNNKFFNKNIDSTSKEKNSISKKIAGVIATIIGIIIVLIIVILLIAFLVSVVEGIIEIIKQYI